MTKTAVIYCRISKDAEGLGLGVENQQKACRDLAKRRKLHVAEVYVDNDISAYTGKKRPAYEAMKEAIKAGQVDVLITWAPDRLTRHVRELEDLIDVLDAHHVDVETVSGGAYDLRTPEGRMQARIVGSVARFESEHKGARQKLKAEQLAADGLPAGGPAPYGYRWEFPERDRGKGRLLHDATEAKHLRWMADRALDGWSSLRIARELNRRGVPMKRGTPWHHSRVGAVLANPTIAGRRTHRGEDAGEGAWKPIIEKGKWDRVRAKVTDPARKHERPALKYLLTGLVESAKGDRMSGTPDKGVPSYVAKPGKDRDGNLVAPKMSLSISADKLDTFVTEAVMVALRDFKPDAPPPVDAGTADEVAEIEGELAELRRLRGAREITMADWLAVRQPLETALAAARAAGGRPAPARPKVLDATDVRAAWARATIDDRRKVVAAVVDRVVIGKATRARWTPMAERVRIEWKA